jgi:hypothetical protein
LNRVRVTAHEVCLGTTQVILVLVSVHTVDKLVRGVEQHAATPKGDGLGEPMVEEPVSRAVTVTVAEYPID